MVGLGRKGREDLSLYVAADGWILERIAEGWGSLDKLLQVLKIHLHVSQGIAPRGSAEQ